MTKKSEKPSKYKLSADSLKSSAEFGYASRLASVLKNAVAPLVFGQYGNALHKQLQARITTAIARGPERKKGNRTMADGEVSILNGLELNPYTRFSTLTHLLFVKATILPKTNTLRIELPAIRSDRFRWPDRAGEAYLNVRCVVVDVHRGIAENYVLEPLAFKKVSADKPPRQATVQATDLEDRMVLVAVGVSFFRTDSDGQDGLISRNRKYYAARLVEAAYVKDGKVAVFTEENKKPGPITPSSTSDVSTIKWDDGD